MAKTVEAMLHPDGTLRLLEPLLVDSPTRVLVTVVPGTELNDVYGRALLDSATPESMQRRAEAVEQYRRNETLSTTEAIQYFKQLVDRGEAK